MEKFQDFTRHSKLLLCSAERFKQCHAKISSGLTSHQLSCINFGVKNQIDESEMMKDFSVMDLCVKYCPTTVENSAATATIKTDNDLINNIGVQFLTTRLNEIRRKKLLNIDKKIEKSETLLTKEMDTKVDSEKDYMICPINNCQHTFNSCELIEHIPKDHCLKARDIWCRTINLLQKLGITFNPKMIGSENVCLGVILYECAENEVDDNSVQLKEENKKQIPILIMASKISWQQCYSNNKEFNENIADNSKFIILWLTTPEINFSYFAALIFHSDKFFGTRSHVIEIRSLQKSQQPLEFVTEDANFVQLGSADINALTDQEDDSIVMSIMLNKNN